MIRKEISLSLDKQPSSPRTLVQQMTDALRSAILDGRFAVGDTLPTWKELARLAGTSLRVPREAIARLADEGLVRSRRRIGAVVLEKGSIVWKGHVLFIQPEGPEASFYSNMRTGTIARNLLDAGFLFTRLIIPGNGHGGYDFQLLETALRQHFDLAIIPDDIPDIRSRLIKARLPFIIGSDRPSRSSLERGVIRKEFASALGAFVADCRSAGIKRVCEVGFRREVYSAASRLRRAGIHVKELIFRPKNGNPRIESVIRASLEGISRRFVRERERLPDLFYFTDDFSAQGAITALLEGGIRIPADVRIITFSVAGFGPVLSKSLSSLQIDPRHDGEEIAKHAIDALLRRSMSRTIPQPLTYNRGQSFPVP